MSPWIIGFIVFWAGPVVASFMLSFTHYDNLRPGRWAGGYNYVYAVTGDRLFWPSLERTLTYALVTVPIGILGSMVLAIMLNQSLVGTNLFRTLFFLPHLTPVVASALLWRWIFQPEYGVVNSFLWKLRIEGPGWMASTIWAMPALIIMSLWGSMGGNRMMIFLAGLQGIPQELYEAAKIDGAGVLARFRHVTLPMLTPTMFFNLVLGVIGALKAFTASYVATEGGPAYATWFFALHIFYQAFRYSQMGYACALAWIFLLILLALTLIQFRTSERWVYYAGGK